MSEHTNHQEGRLTVSCYKCTAGCIHLEYSNVMFTFTQEQFLTFSEIIGETRRVLLLEQQTDDPFTAVEAMVM